MMLTANPTPKRIQPKAEMVYTGEAKAHEARRILISQGYTVSLICGRWNEMLNHMEYAFDAERI